MDPWSRKVLATLACALGTLGSACVSYTAQVQRGSHDSLIALEVPVG